MPGTQISFRNVEASRVARVEVVGSRSGDHEGRVEADSDGRGASFVPVKPFVAGETVTVTTHLKLVGVGDGEYHFRIEHPAMQIGPGKLSLARTVPGGTQQFRSRPDLTPTAVAVATDSAPQADGDIFVAPQNGPTEDGPMILDPKGRLVWFHATPVDQQLLTTDFRVSKLHGRKVLTWWQGNTNRGSGRGVGVIYNRRYRRVATVHAGNGLEADLHEFMVTNKGDAWMIAASPVSLPGLGRPVIDSVVQEIDIKTGLVLFEWHALDHVALSESYKYTANQPGHVVDPYHANSISLDRAGDVIVSMRNTSAIYKLDRRTGRIIWRLGGKRSSFKMGPGTTTGFQHSVTVHPDGTLTIFDNGAGPPKVHPYSRGIRVSLNAGTMTASLVQTYDHSPTISANFEGGVQKLRRRSGVPRLRPAAVLHSVRLSRAGGLRRALRDLQLELPRLSLQVERQAGEPAGGGGGPLRRVGQRLGELERRDGGGPLAHTGRPEAGLATAGDRRPQARVRDRGHDPGARLRGRPGAGRQGPCTRPVAHGRRRVNRDPTRPAALVH